MKSPRHADTKERTEKHKNHNGGMVEVEQHIILHITLVRNLLREFVCTVVIVYFAFHLWVVCFAKISWFRNVRNVCSQAEICGVTWRKKCNMEVHSISLLSINTFKRNTSPEISGSLKFFLNSYVTSLYHSFVCQTIRDSSFQVSGQTI